MDRRLSARASMGGLPEVCREGPRSSNLDRPSGYYLVVGSRMDRLTASHPLLAAIIVDSEHYGP